MTFTPILAASDFSRPAEAAVHRAALLAKAHGAALEVVHSLSPAPLTAVFRQLIEGQGLSEAELAARAERRLQGAVADLNIHHEITATGQLLTGKPTTAIVAHAAAVNAALVVLGAHGEHRLLDLFIGSTALKLLRLLEQPVLVVKQTPLFEYERVLIATDFSVTSRHASNFAARLLPQADMHLFHVFEAPFERELHYAGSDDHVIEDYRRLGQQEARRQMDEFIRSLDEPERFIGRVRHGYAPALVNQYSAEINADLLVLGSNRQSGLSATLFGSVATHLVQESRGDLLLVPLLDATAAEA
ncbi:MAG: universal stress protein [Sterolibacterium sp.]|nr:universal stress protein [Sterolibacterium sp.]